jgi:formylglycine-generating enzyme
MRAWLLLLAALAGGCGLVAGLDEFEAVNDDDTGVFEVASDETSMETSITDTTMVEDVLDSGTTVDTGVVDTAPVDMGPPTCIATPAKMISMGAWSIDAIEVTNAQYAAFLTAVGTDTTGQPAQCVGNTSYVPTVGWPASAAKCDHPVVYVDWCDAFAYCKWAKKRLCGNPSGGATPADGSGPITAATSQWYAACSVNGIAKYPYGDAWASATCVDNSFDGTGGTGTTDTTRVVGTATKCHGVAGAWAEVLDLVGNVREWEDACNDSKDLDDDCKTRGGSFAMAGDKANCVTTESNKRKVTAGDLGFRCCSP